MSKTGPRPGGKLRPERVEELQQAVDLFIITGSITAAAREAGVPRSTMLDRFDSAVEEHVQPSAAALKEAGLKRPTNVPFSEDEKKFKEDWGQDDCIAELKRIVEANPDQVISRNHFRVFSAISESTWNRFFGTFHEFKRQAGVILSRHAHTHERNIAKHAAHDKMRDMTVEKRLYEGKYERPASRRWQSILVGSDIHDKECDPFWRRVFIDTARRMQPEIVCLCGDVFDLPEFSRFTQDPREWDVVGRIEWVHAFLKDLREACPQAQVDLVEGNHEFRLMRHLAEATPALRAVLSDLHGFTVSKLLGLDDYEINYIARMDLAAWRERDLADELRSNWVKYFDAVVGHHYPHGRQMGFPGWNGHNHKHVVWAGFSAALGPTEWHQIGCGHLRDATYTEGEKWTNGLLAAHVDTHTASTVFDYSALTDHCVVGGKFYFRSEDETVTPH